MGSLSGSGSVELGSLALTNLFARVLPLLKVMRGVCMSTLLGSSALCRSLDVICLLYCAMKGGGCASVVLCLCGVRYWALLL